ncbi:hypothetical protein UPYG_G00175000 [Umbra pygmaea]|uniref:Apoptosis facilitator Bcl-2-like protein 14 n=1 Tax=Umbra pygmaea TaxID=75934 RepID=A0ABD0WPK3_UMBPY
MADSANVAFMEDTLTKVPKKAQLLSLGRKDTSRLLDVYVRRSISLNDGTCEEQRKNRKSRKWVTMSQKRLQGCRPSSYPSVTSVQNMGDEGQARSTPSDRTVPYVSPEIISGPVDVKEFETSTEVESMSKEGKQSKKSSFWKSFLGFFTKKGSDKDEESSTEKHRQSQEAPEKKKSIGRKNSLKRISIIKRKFDRGPARKGSLARNRTNRIETTGVESVLDVAPTDSYYEKVSEELEKIVHEVESPLADEDIMKRIIVLIKQRGDAIDCKLKDSPSLSSFFQKLSYNTFIFPKAKPHSADNAPELVKFAFTLDFTARVACLSQHSTSHIMGLGHRYLEDRFTQTQVNPDQPSHNLDDQ